MFVEHRTAGQARPRALHAPPGERAHPLSVPRRAGALAQQHRGEVVPVVERQVPFRVDERIGRIGDEHNLAAGDERFADRGRQPRRDRISASSRGRGAVRPADRGEHVRSRAIDGEQRRRRAVERRDDAEFKRIARQDARPCRRAPRARAERWRSRQRRRRRAQSSSDRIPARPRRFHRRSASESRAIRRLGGAGEPHGNFKALAGAKSRARRLRDDEPRPLQVGQPFRRKRADGSERP